VRQARSRYQACDFAAAEPRRPDRGPTVPAQQACDRTFLLQREACPRWTKQKHWECVDHAQEVHFDCLEKIKGTLALEV